MFLGIGRLCLGARRRQRIWGLAAANSASSLVGAARLRRATRLVTGALAIRRQGIYFAMITLALSQMVYFFCLQAPFTHGEDGIQGVPQGKLFGFIDLLEPDDDVLLRAGGVRRAASCSSIASSTRRSATC